VQTGQLKLLCGVRQRVLHPGGGVLCAAGDVRARRVAENESSFSTSRLPCYHTKTSVLRCLPCIYTSWGLLHISSKFAGVTVSLFGNVTVLIDEFGSLIHHGG
jgi:hypothetical protein